MECRHIFSNGKRCRCRALDTHVFCLHHAPQPRPRTLRPRNANLGTWRQIQIHLATLSREEIPAAILTLLSSLLEDGPRSPSDRTAGALLRALVRTCGKVPFALPTDPAPERDWAFDLSQSMDRVCDIIRRNKQFDALESLGLLPSLQTAPSSHPNLSTSSPLPNSTRMNNHPAPLVEKRGLSR
ncbi:MAG TPA: hypothetical protein VHE33_02020 [Acidobacteriaceae bacterium]|nr:hypothetical protein [Acidobacteriaceae bacterium]